MKCVHCYAHAKASGGPDEMTTKEGLALIDDLAEFGSPVILFSGGEPLMVRPDLTRLIRHAGGPGHAGRDFDQRHLDHGRTRPRN